MTAELKFNLTDEEKDILSKARELTDKLGDTMRRAADNIIGLENDTIAEIYERADLCDYVYVELNNLCDEFGIERG